MRGWLLVGLFMLAGCQAADRAQFYAYGDDAFITCYSGGNVIYEGWSDGKLKAEEHSGGWYFMEKGTAHLVRVSGDCVVRN